MSLKKYQKQTTEGDQTPERFVMEILHKNGEQEFPDLYELFMKEINKNKKEKIKFTKVGLWKVLSRLEKKGDIEKITSNNIQVYRVLPKSKILAEIKGIAFRTIFHSGRMIFQDELIPELDKNPTDALLKYFGFYFIGSMLASRTVNEEQRPDWLKQVFNLEKEIEHFELLLGNNQETLKQFVKILQHQYKQNMNILAHSVTKSVDANDCVDKFDFSKEMVDFVKKQN